LNAKEFLVNVLVKELKKNPNKYNSENNKKNEIITEKFRNLTG